MKFEDKIFSISSEEEFQDLAMEIFRYQLKTNAVYNKYFSHLDRGLESIKSIEQIPFLPIEMFREHMVITGNKSPQVTFESSGTTGQKTSKHFVVSEEIYRQSFLKSFESKYGDPKDLCILALLPSYLERENSSLVYMMDHLIGMSHHKDSGFYLDNLEALNAVLQSRRNDSFQTLLIGVSFALLDLAENFPLALSDNIIVMETGGMKGRRKEMVREELHAVLRNAFSLDNIHSEYGMTELLSQAYSKGSGMPDPMSSAKAEDSVKTSTRFFPPPWMKVMTRDMYDPLTILPFGQSGGINIIDLANIYSASFIATSDLGIVYEDGSFELTGRYDQADIRGCNLMVV